jgi:hypothetical protein
MEVGREIRGQQIGDVFDKTLRYLTEHNAEIEFRIEAVEPG